MESTSDGGRVHDVTGADRAVPVPGSQPDPLPHIGPGPAVRQIGPARLTLGFDQYQRIGLAAHERLHGRARPLDLSDLAELAAAGFLCERDATAFPFARKLEAVADAAARRDTRPVVVVDGTEREPGSAKDEVLLTRAPHLVLDGAELAAAALGAREIVVGVADDLAAASVRHAIRERRMTAMSRVVRLSESFLTSESGPLIGAGRGRQAAPTHASAPPNAPVPPNVPSGPIPPGMQVLPGIPVPVPPGPLDSPDRSGALDQPGPFVPPGRARDEAGGGQLPALLSNAETLAQLALLVLLGVREYGDVGIRSEPGTVLLTVTGSARFPAVVEIPTGAPLGHLLDLCGASLGPGVLVGGYHGTWLGRTAATAAEVSRESITAAGGVLGAGIIMPIGRRTCPLGECAAVARQLAADAVGCAPCRPGLAAIATALNELAAGRHGGADQALLTSRAGGPHGPGSAECRHLGGMARFAASAVDVFAADLADHLTRGTCGSPVLGLLPARRAAGPFPPRWHRPGGARRP